MNDMTGVDLVRKEIIQLNLTTKELIQVSMCLLCDFSVS